MKRLCRVGSMVCAVWLTACSDEISGVRTPQANEEAGVGARSVELVRDDHGIMHVYGSDDEAVFHGQGYAVATDRLFQIELMRRQAFGTQAELLGEKSLEGDIASRALNFAALGKADLERLRTDHPELVPLAQAWADGINARLKEIESGQISRPYGFGSEELDFVPEPWLIEHVFAVGKLLTFGMSSSFESEILASALRKLGPQFYAAVPLAQPTYDAFTMRDYAGFKRATVRGQPAAKRTQKLPKGVRYKHRFLFGRPQSNNWAVSGALTDTGRPLLAGDPHQPLDSPTRFWPVHLNSKDAGGSYDVIGFAFAGVPGVQLGHNDRVGWTATTNFADVMDLFEVTVDDQGTLKLADESHAVVERKEVFSVRGEDGKLSKQTVTLRDVPGQGVLLPDEMLPVPVPLLVDDTQSNAILMKWTGFSPSSEFAAYAQMGKARDLDEWQKGVDSIEVGAVNLVAADAAHILYHVHANVPDRGDPSKLPMPWRVIPGQFAPALWGNGFLGAEHLPGVRDPEVGFVGTANNDPWGFTADGDTSNDAFYYGNFYARGFRAQRIRTLLTDHADSGKKVTRADMEEMQRDVYSGMADTLVPRLVSALEAQQASVDAPFKADAEVAAAVAALEVWDRRFTRDSGAAVLFLATEWFGVKNAFADKLGAQLFDPIASADPPYLLGMLRNTVELRYESAESMMPGGRDLFLLGALRAAIDWAKQRFGSADVSRFKLADVHVAEFDNKYGGKFDGGLVPVNGSADTVNVSAAPFFEGGVPRSMFVAEDGSLYRMVVGFGEDGVPEATLNFARGTSEDPTSPHFDDRQGDWTEVEYQPLAFRKADVLAHEESRTVLTLPSR